ncbi:MAG: molybdopterin-dependent oxidoreductase [Gordonibacter pamelaeae]
MWRSLPHQDEGFDILSDRLPKYGRRRERLHGRCRRPRRPRDAALVPDHGDPGVRPHHGLLQRAHEHSDGRPLSAALHPRPVFNPLSATRQPKKVEALKKLDFYVVMDTQWNSSCDYADYVLPACTQLRESQQFARRTAAGTFDRH